jgi:hypothetical protein
VLPKQNLARNNSSPSADENSAIPTQPISLAPNIVVGPSISALNPVSVRSWLTLTSSTKSIATQKREKSMWKPGDTIVWRGIFRNRIWHAQTAILEKRQYPFDGSWLDWMPDPSWTPPKLPENWDKF